MKNFVMLFAVLAIFIVPSSFCVAKNADVYSGSWSQFLGNLKTKCDSTGINFNGTTKNREGEYSAYFANRNVEVTAISTNFNKYIYSIFIYQRQLGKNDDSAQFGRVLIATLATLGLNKSEIEEWYYKFVHYLTGNLKSNKLKKKYSLYCSSKRKYIDIVVSFKYGKFNVNLIAHT